MEMSFSSPEIKPPRRSAAQTFQTLPCSPLANPLSHFTPPSSQQSPSTHQQVLSKPARGQWEAIEVLKDYEDCDVLAWLAFAGAIGIDFGFRPNARAFSRQLVNAIAVLCDSGDTIVLEWLQAARTEAAQTSTRSAPTKTLYDLNIHVAGSTQPEQCFENDDRLTEKPVKSGQQSHRKTADTSKRRRERRARSATQTSIPRLLSTTSKTEKDDHLYWCTRCRRKYKNSDDCKKHEKEHSFNYICQANEEYVKTELGVRCGYCDVLHPSHEHFETHDAMCRNADGTITTFKRRYDMVNHLRSHGITHEAEDIADDWKIWSSKKAFSCGFCVQYFATQQDYLKHVHCEHFKGRHQTMEDWDPVKVVQGLLEQPDIKDHWQRLKSSEFTPPRIKWSETASEDLLQRLEVGPNGDDTAESLAQTAYDALDWDYGLLMNVEADPWNGINDTEENLSNSYLSPRKVITGYPRMRDGDLVNTQLATPYTDSHSTQRSSLSLHTPGVGSLVFPKQAPKDHNFGGSEDIFKKQEQHPQEIDFAEGTIDYLTTGAVGASPTISDETLHAPPSPCDSPSIKQRIKRACRRKSKHGLVKLSDPSKPEMDLGLDDVQRKMYDDEYTRSDVRGNGS